MIESISAIFQSIPSIIVAAGGVATSVVCILILCFIVAKLVLTMTGENTRTAISNMEKTINNLRDEVNDLRTDRDRDALKLAADSARIETLILERDTMRDYISELKHLIRNLMQTIEGIKQYIPEGIPQPQRVIVPKAPWEP